MRRRKKNISQSLTGTVVIIRLLSCVSMEEWQLVLICFRYSNRYHFKSLREYDYQFSVFYFIDCTWIFQKITKKKKKTSIILKKAAIWVKISIKCIWISFNRCPYTKISISCQQFLVVWKLLWPNSSRNLVFSIETRGL